ncbi:MAG: translocation/assembly module TamB domain-containing protein [Prevotellaceae bacterium]|nr:translocation/assembly module TamB domain-containing protein [Candidatus Minthosoma caballi]
MQTALASWTADALSSQTKSKVEIGSINLGFLNRIIVNDITVYEPNGDKMLSVARVSASIDLFSLMSGQIDIGAAQLFGTKAILYKDTPDSEPNYQFLIDAFSSKDKEKPSVINLSLSSFIIRHADITYDVKSEPTRPGKIDANHLSLQDCGMNLTVHCLTNDSLNASIKRLQAKELNSKLSIHDTSLQIQANAKEAHVENLSISLPHSQFEATPITVCYEKFKEKGEFSFSKTDITASVTPSDIAFVSEKLSSFTDPISISISAEGDDKKISINNLSISSIDEQFLLIAKGNLHNPTDKNNFKAETNISKLYIDSEYSSNIASMLNIGENALTKIEAIGDLFYSGSITYSKANGIVSDGNAKTNAGDIVYDAVYDSDKFLTGNIKGDNINLALLTDNEDFGTTSLDLNFAANLANMQGMPSGKVEGEISHIEYKQYDYQNISINATSIASELAGKLSINDENIKMNSDFAYSDAQSKNIELQMLIERFAPEELNLIDNHKGESVSMSAFANLHGSDFNHLFGNISIENLLMHTPNDSYELKSIDISAHSEGKTNYYTITSDIVNGNIKGEVNLADIATSFSNHIGKHLPIFIKPTADKNSDFSYDLALSDAPILHHFIDTDYNIEQPIKVSGNVKQSEMTMNLTAPSIEYSGTPYTGIELNCFSDTKALNIEAVASSIKPASQVDHEDNITKLKLKANAHANTINGDVNLDIDGKSNINLHLLPTVHLTDSLGRLKTDITLHRSHALINDTTWTVYPANISLFGKEIECRGIKFANDNINSSIAINGRASTSNADSLVASLNNVEIEYILSLINFSVVRFTGKASGQAIVNRVLGGGVPDVRANLTVNDLTVQDGPIGDATITAHWDKEVDGIAMKGRFVDLFEAQDGLNGKTRKVTGVTTLDGWISPSKNDMRLDVNTMNTNAKFLHGFLRGVFKEVDGTVTGPIAIVGPLNNVNIVGDAVPNLNLRLKATNVPYHIEGDTLHLRNYLFDFPNITLQDKYGNKSKISGKVTHRNMKNFKYDFDADLHELCAYDENEFNSDKFMATVFADGKLTISGSDGHPLYVNADVTPTKGSVFAYDAATPDAIMGNGFIEFRDRDSIASINDLMEQSISSQIQREVQRDSLSIVNEAKKNYRSDIYINFNINLTPACEVKLRMDNLDDGYMSTFGYATLSAKWYNKGTFQLFGYYNIIAGKHRLYLQDIIFRDLALQAGSNVEFNGNPFDANIHLICHHTIPSVPLSDLTATTAFSQNNKVKVTCILDITGKLGNMDFKFDMDIPNVNEEARQLVRSMINSEEEMNTQMIYLLGLGRFYPNEYARANGSDNSSQAVNSLLSSTLSGQINQMLSNVIGNNSNWNFGSALTTGEKGWDDLDVEGILSGRLLDERLLINGNFGYRDNALTNQSNFIGDFEVKWRMTPTGNLYVKGYNQTNDRYFTKATLNTQGFGLSWQHDFEWYR